MGSKIDGFVVATRERKLGEPLTQAALLLVDLLDNETMPADMLDASDELDRVDKIRGMLKQASDAFSELEDERSQQLYDLMAQKSMQNFSRNGKTRYLTEEVYVGADKDQGGVNNPNLMQWLEAHGMANIVKLGVNAGSLRSGVKEWLGAHPTQFNHDEFGLLDADELAALAMNHELSEEHRALAISRYDSLAESLGLEPIEEPAMVPEGGGPAVPARTVSPREQLHRRRRDRAELLGMVKITRTPKVGSRAVPKK